MKRMLVIVPTRGRPENAQRLENARRETETTGLVDFLYVVDDDDPKAMEYARAAQLWGARAVAPGHSGGLPVPSGAEVRIPLSSVAIAPRMRMIGSLNHFALRYAPDYDYLGFMGDDHAPRTQGWDRQILDVLDDPGARVVYGNDLLQGPNLPTAVFMHSVIVRAAGFFAPPLLTHLYADNYWKELGQALDGLVYLPDTIIEHVHPAAGKAAMDDGYREANHPSVDRIDRDVWLSFHGGGGFDLTVEKVRQAYRWSGVQR